MNLGRKISSLRKKNNLSQEQLAEKVGVTRQTISKWELEETTPDIKEAKILSNIFCVSLDELVNNDINSILVEKVSNTEKLAGIIIKILKVIGILLIIFFVVNIVIFILFNINSTASDSNKIVGKYSLTCKIDNEEYLYETEYNKNFQAINSGGDSFITDHIDVESCENSNQIVAHIEDYFKDHSGSCKIEQIKK